MNTEPIVIEQAFKVPASRIWSAITRKEEMKLWYFDLPEFKAVPGFQFQFSGGPTPERQYLHLCEIMEVIPDRKLAYTWRYDGYPGVSEVVFELTGNGDEILLRLVHLGLETFPEDNADLSKQNFQIGWKSIVSGSLKEYLEPSDHWLIKIEKDRAGRLHPFTKTKLTN